MGGREEVCQRAGQGVPGQGGAVHKGEEWMDLKHRLNREDRMALNYLNASEAIPDFTKQLFLGCMGIPYPLPAPTVSLHEHIPKCCLVLAVAARSRRGR